MEPNKQLDQSTKHLNDSLNKLNRSIDKRDHCLNILLALAVILLITSTIFAIFY